MNNDLISREALKKEVENLVTGGAEALKDFYEKCTAYDENSWISGIYDAWELIGNAPTVEINTNDIEYKAYCKGLEDGKKIARPQGKWEEFFESNDKTYHKCSHCHISSELILFGNFCPNCGADMRKGGNE